MATNDELMARARFIAGQIIDRTIDPVSGATIIWKECSLNCQPKEESLDPFVYWVSEYDDADDADRAIYCRRAIVESARHFLNPSTPTPAE